MPFAIRIHETGGPDALRLEKFDLAPPAADELQLAQTAVGVDFIDTYHRSGLYALPELPHGIGLEAAGRVIARGAAANEFAIGDRVAYLSRPPGAYCTHRNVPAEHCVRLPEDVSDEVAAALILKGLTADYLANSIIRLRRDEEALVYAAAGATGSILVQLLVAQGVRVLGVVGSDEKASRASALGAEAVFVAGRGERAYDDLPAWVREKTDGAGVRVAYDSIGRDSFEASLGSLRRRGMMVTYGNASGPPPALDPLRLSTSGSLFLTRPTLFDYVSTREELGAGCARLFQALRAGALTIDIGQRWALRDAAEAHRALENRQTVGPTVLTVSGEQT